MKPLSKHTPGPWQVSGVRQRGIDHWQSLHMVGPDGGSIAGVLYTDRTTELHVESLANARLIAAAPKLLQALKIITLHAPSLDVVGIRELADEAIATAEGAAP